MIRVLLTSQYLKLELAGTHLASNHWLLATPSEADTIRISRAQWCLTLCHPVDCSPLGSSVHGIFQARILEQVAISSSRGSAWPRDWTLVSLSLLHWQADSLSLHHQGSHLERYYGYHQFAEADLEINQLAPNHAVVEGQSQGSHPAWPMKGQTSWLLRWIPLPRQAHSTLGPSVYLEKVVFIMGFPGGSDGKESAICLLLFSPLPSYSVSTLWSHTEPFILLSHVRILQIFGNRSLFYCEHG